MDSNHCERYLDCKAPCKKVSDPIGPAFELSKVEFEEEPEEELEEELEEEPEK